MKEVNIVEGKKRLAADREEKISFRPRAVLQGLSRAVIYKKPQFTLRFFCPLLTIARE